MSFSFIYIYIYIYDVRKHDLIQIPEIGSQGKSKKTDRRNLMNKTSDAKINVYKTSQQIVFPRWTQQFNLHG